jgi:hypothetical protein
MNPDACKHNITQLAAAHPFNRFNLYSSADRNWTDYMRHQCDHEEGYYGMFCGTCLKGYGSTAPFQCQHCAGADSNGVISQSTVSGLWFFYWFVLAAWYVFTVWTSLRDKPERVATVNSETYHEAGLLDIAKVRRLFTTARHGTARHGAARHGMARLGMVRVKVAAYTD